MSKGSIKFTKTKQVTIGKRRAERKAAERRLLITGLVLDAALIGTTVVTVKAAVGKVKARKARKAAFDFHANPDQLERLAKANMALAHAEYELAGTSVLSVSRVKAHSLVNRAEDAVKAEQRLLDAQRVAYGSQARGADALGALGDSITKRNKRAEKRAAKRVAQDEAEVSNLTVVSN